MITFIKTCKQTLGPFVSNMAPTEGDGAAPALFAQCRFAMVSGDRFSADDAQKV